MKADTKKELNQLLRKVILSKLYKYKAETDYSPFFEAIFSKERVITSSLIHSFYTSFGISLYEQIAVILARGAGYIAKRQDILFGEIDQKTEELIHSIHNKLRKGETPDKGRETELIRDSIQPGKAVKDPDSVVDLYIRKPEGEEYYFDITSPKPNKKEFVELKRKLLRWVALRLSQNKNAKINTRVAMPYNPYHPKPYSRWTSGTMYDTSELLVGKDFWNFVAGEDVYDELIRVFVEVGKELRDKIRKIDEK